MESIKFDILPPPEALKRDVECIRVGEYSGAGGLVINVSLNGLPGIAFQHHDGHSPLESITTPTHYKSDVPTLYVYGQQTEPGVMTYKSAYTITQVILKPHALKTLLGLNATVLTSDVVELSEFGAEDLNYQLLKAHSQRERTHLLTDYLVKQLQQEYARDELVEASLRLIHANIGSVTVKTLLEALSISERQFERRFSQTVGVSPHFYIRVKRFNAAIRLMTSGRFTRLADVAYALHYYDQSHFIRDIKEFSGITPKNLSQKIDDFRAEQPIFAHV
jgi:AraC-like DNA-binding protein